MKKLLTLILFVSSLSIACSPKMVPHNGVFPFSTMEKPLSKRSALKKSESEQLVKLEKALTYTPEDSANFGQITKSLKPGDIISFYMTHVEARGYLKKRKIQKIPYELFSFGHLALVVSNPETSTPTSDFRLLQVAMKQHSNADSKLNYLKDKSWIVYRAPAGAIDNKKLHAFTQQVCANEKSTYSYTSTFGLSNKGLHPNSMSDIKDKYTCSTLVIAALHHAGFQLHSPRRNGYLDIITPRQVVDSWGSSVYPPED